jgi:hypothetical protein
MLTGTGQPRSQLLAAHLKTQPVAIISPIRIFQQRSHWSSQPRSPRWHVVKNRTFFGRKKGAWRKVSGVPNTIGPVLQLRLGSVNSAVRIVSIRETASDKCARL